MLQGFPSSWEINNHKKKLVVSNAHGCPCKMNVASKRNKRSLRRPSRTKDAKLFRHSCKEQSGTGVVLARSIRMKL